jgi:uncharacterized membrane protein
MHPAAISGPTKPAPAPRAEARLGRLKSSAILLAVAVTLAGYGSARILEISPGSVPRTAIVSLDVFSAMAFALFDGARAWGLRTILVFTGLCAVVGNIVENIGVVTGFPFGRYEFLELMGPKLLHVPVLLGLAYAGMAYVSWNVACLILARPGSTLSWPRALVLPAVASMVMTAWDLAQDPVWSTVLHGWVWQHGGPWFGVPVSNYLGWLLTVFTIYLLFSFFLNRKSRDRLWQRQVPASGRAVLFYALCALGNVLQTIPRPDPALVADPTGRLWRVTAITGASALVSVFLMGTFAALAWLRASRNQAEAKD